MKAIEFIKSKGLRDICINPNDHHENQTFLSWLIDEYAEEYHKEQLLLTCVGSSTLPKGYKIYECTDCQELNLKKDNRQITVGICNNCEHPLWNDDVD